MPKRRPSSSPEDYREARRVELDEFDRRLRELSPHTPATFLLLGVSCFVFFWMAISAGGGWLEAFSDDTLAAWGANQPALTADRQGWRLFASIFVHAWLLQLLFNGWTLFDLGRLTERLFGSIGFLLVFLTTGFAANLAQVIAEPGRLVAGSTGAVFGLLGALAGFLVRQRRAVPDAATARLRKSVPAFVAFNVGYGLILHRLDAAYYLGGAIAGLACGLILARPLTAESDAKRWRGNGVVVILGAALVFAAALVVEPPPTSLRAERLRNRQLDGRLTEAYQAARTEFLNDRLSAAEFADQIDDEILPAWRAERARLQTLQRVPQADETLWTELKQYAALSERAWTLTSEALRSGDTRLLEQAEEQIAEAERLARELDKRMLPKESSDRSAAGVDSPP
jgi:rhomboid protease GluP